MDSKLEKVTVTDSNMLANEIMNEIIDIDKMERTYETELSSADLFKIDCAILSSLKKTQDFSRDLLKQLENGKFEEVLEKPPKKADIMKDIQKNTMLDIVYPLQEMFDSLSEIVLEKIA